MTFFKWIDKMSVDIVEIDEQHKMLIGMINKLNENKSDPDTVDDVLFQMTDYLAHHFSTEEKYMIKFNFPGYDEHRKEHEYFVSQTMQFLRADNFIDVDPDERLREISNELLHFLKDWLITHILETDPKYVSCFKEQGVK